jgi:hypothetical protein
VLRGAFVLTLIACANDPDPAVDAGRDMGARDADPDGAVADTGGDTGSADATPADADPRDADPDRDATPADADGMDGGAADADPNADAAPIDAGPPNPSLSFFVTSIGNGANGGDFGGLPGADARCQALAIAAGGGARTWRAYLSTAGNGGATVHARERIGQGPWSNAQGAMVAASLAALHANGIPSSVMQDENGDPVPTAEHDILTGTMNDGNAWTEFPGNPAAPPPNCLNWTSSDPNAYTYVGHSDWDIGSGTWNAAHETTCDRAGLMSTLGSGRLYCFAAD